MPDLKPTDALNDDALAREIEAVLAAEPSPEFVARVRTRIAEEPARASRWTWLQWSFAAAAAVVLFAAAAAVFNRSSNEQTITVSAPPALSPAVPPGAAASGPTMTHPGPVQEARVVIEKPSRRRPAAQIVRHVPEPPIETRLVLSKSEMDALQQLIAHSAKGLELPPPPPLTSDTVAQAQAEVFAPAEAFALEPIFIKPLTSEISEGERQ